MGSTLTFKYGSSEGRYKQIANLPGSAMDSVLLYIDPLSQRETVGGVVNDRIYIDGVATITIKSIGVNTIALNHMDRLGSPIARLDEDGEIMEARSFDPFGQPRDGDFSGSGSGTLNSQHGPEGFTGHEHLDGVKLIHMNGRGYDYQSGQFLSVDPFIAGGSQGVNPYAYVENNPLSGTDPSGYARHCTSGSKGACGSLESEPVSTKTRSKTEINNGYEITTVTTISSEGTVVVKTTSVNLETQERFTVVGQSKITRSNGNVIVEIFAPVFKFLGAVFGGGVPCHFEDNPGETACAGESCIPQETVGQFSEVTKVLGAGVVGKLPAAAGATQRAANSQTLGNHSKVGGHHVHAKAAVKDSLVYDSKTGFAISQAFMRRNGLDHTAMSTYQRRASMELNASGRANTLSEHTRIAVEALVKGGASRKMARSLTAKSLNQLRQNGVRVPTNTPWYK